MVKRFFSAVLLVILFGVGFVASFPKERLYFYAQKRLQEYNIDIEAKQYDSHPFSLQLQNVSIYYADAPVVKVKTIEVTPFSLLLRNLQGIGLLADIVPPLDTIRIYPKSGQFLSIVSHYGTATGLFDFKQKKIIITIVPVPQAIQKYTTLLDRCKKVGEHYVYEYHF